VVFSLRGSWFIMIWSAFCLVGLRNTKAQPINGQAFLWLVALPALKTTVFASVQGFLSLLVAAVIATLTTVRTAFQAEESDVEAGSSLLDVDVQFRTAFMADGCGSVDAFTGLGHCFTSFGFGRRNSVLID
jgi:hypothetical protein